MILKIIVCSVLVLWAMTSQKPLLPSLIYGGLTYWAGSMAQMAGIKTSNLYIVSGLGFVLSFFVFWLIKKSSNIFLLKWLLAVIALLFLVIYPLDPAMLKNLVH